jgi:hypothetical protein
VPLPDRYDYAWPPLGRLTGSGGPTLTCPASGRLPVPVRPVEVAWRGGIDLQPVDVADETAVAWLEVCVWPEQDERRARLRDAVATARSDPPRIVPGDLFDLLPAQVEDARQHGQVVVFHSAVALYLDRPHRQRHEILPSVTATAAQEPDDWHAFVLGVDGWAVAFTHQHGAGLRWL